jgi:hypothetical protein
MKRLVSFMVIAAFVLALATVAVARGAPDQPQSYAVEQTIAPDLAPVVTSIPPLSAGYDVIQNKSDDSNTYMQTVATERRQSPTVANCARAAPQPKPVMRS